jgi:hypothetical protein
MVLAKPLAGAPRGCNLLPALEFYRYRGSDLNSSAPEHRQPDPQIQEIDMNHSVTSHPIALRAALLSILITSSMALLPALAGIGAHRNSHDGSALQAATLPAPSAKATG